MSETTEQAVARIKREAAKRRAEADAIRARARAEASWIRLPDPPHRSDRVRGEWAGPEGWKIQRMLPPRQQTRPFERTNRVPRGFVFRIVMANGENAPGLLAHSLRQAKEYARRRMLLHGETAREESE